jgi:hypothetical protein
MDPIPISYNRGEQNFELNGKGTSLTLLDFWAWAFSDVLTNTSRGVLAEFIVAHALGLDIQKPREAWARYDLEYQGLGIEVKSAAYHQRWYQKKMSSITFGVPKRRGWDAQSGHMEQDSIRQASVYVLCLLAEKDRSQVSPLQLDQWQFWVVPTEFFDQRKRSQHSITLNSLICEVGQAVSYEMIREEVDALLTQKKASHVDRGTME